MKACVLWCLGFGTLSMRLGLKHQKLPKSLFGVGRFTQADCLDYPNGIFSEDRFFSTEIKTFSQTLIQTNKQRSNKELESSTNLPTN